MFEEKQQQEESGCELSPGALTTARPTPESKVSPVEKELLSLSLTIERNHQLLEVLEKKLVPILIAQPPEGESGEKEKELVPLAMEVRNRRRMILNANKKLDSIISRIQI